MKSDPGTLDPKCTPRELIEHGQKAKCLPIARLIRDEVAAPDVVRILSLMRVDRAGSRPATLHGLLRHSQALLTTKQSDLLPPDTPARCLQLVEDLPVAKAWIAFRELMDLHHQLVLFDLA